MIIGVSGKKQSGKDTVGRIIQYLTTNIRHSYNFLDYINPNVNYAINDSRFPNMGSDWKIVKFANALKITISHILNEPDFIEKWEKNEDNYRDKPIGKEWQRIYFKGAYKGRPDKYNKRISPYFETLEEAYAYKDFKKDFSLSLSESIPEIEFITRRMLLQELGTNAGREVHPNIWVNATMRDYKIVQYYHGKSVDKGIYDVTEEDELLATIEPTYPNWIITDMRFPNELKAVKDREGITIRVNSKFIDHEKEITRVEFVNDTHESETALDNAKFDYVIDNDGTIDELIIRVKNILKDTKLC